MRRRKKVLALVLAMAMSLSLAVTAGAAFNDQDKIVNEEAVDMCVALNIINGRTNGDFDPAGNVTRAEAAKMICIALNGGKEPVLSASATSAFADINGHWAAKYIEYCVSLGIVAGKSATTFDPNGNVTGTELAKMLLIALGYNAEHEKFVGANWDTNVNVVASQKNLYEDLETIDPSVALSRDNAAQMIWNALQAVLVEYEYTLVSGENGLTSQVVVKDVEDDETLLEDKYVAEIEYAYMTGASYDDEKAEYTYTFMTDAAFGGAAIAREDALCVTSVKSADDYSDLFGQKVAVVHKDNTAKTVYGIYAYESEVVATGIVDDISDISGKDLEIAGVEYTMTNNVNATKVWEYNDLYNKGFVDAYAVAANAPYEFALIDNTDDGKADAMVAFPFSVGEITYMNGGKFTVKVGGTSTTDKVENVAMYDGAAKGDYVVIVDSANVVGSDDVYTKLDTVISGDVTATKNGGATFTIDGTTYKAAAASATIENTSYTVAAGDTVKEAVVYNGFAFYVDKTSSALVEDYALVIGYKAADGINNAQVKLLFTDGTDEVVTLDDSAANYAAIGQSGKTINVGDLVTFDVDDNEYTLAAALTSQSAAKESGFDTIVSGSYSYAKDGKSTIGGNYIDADAIVFVKDGPDYKVISGAKLAKINDTVTVKNVYANDDSATGYSTVALASVVATVSSDDVKYGYVVSDVETVQNADGDKVLSFTMFDGEKDVPVLTVKGDLTTYASLAKGDFVSYTESDTAIDISGTIDFDGAYAGAITKYNGSDEISFVAGKTTEMIAGASKDVVNVSGTAYANQEIDEDTVIFYVDVADVTGIPGGSLELATKTPGGNYYANVFATMTSGHVDLIIFCNDMWQQI